MARHRLVVCGCMLACFLFACQQVLGTELRQPKEDEEIDPNSSPVDEKNLYRMEDGTLVQLFPEPETHLQFANSTRRKLGEFLGCAFCKCCDAEKTFCKAGLPCCYSINCNVQPFGLCKFIPVACNCNGCGI
ncbi:hypothetical protein R1flu_017797 [Riccia fluitans]|uniref:DUF7866 domain-containing protein n=1 Tax=Riccia fluitans TaxID=41844 RepID=A0ABD1ZHZ0_9MARC